jgi:phospholipase C
MKIKGTFHVGTAAFALGLASSLLIHAANTATPIQHVVVIFDENNSFDHYFATYPVATNPVGEPPFNALPSTPSVHGLTPALIANNPNSTKPFRLDRT